jgi:hypothetical protein
VVSVQNPVSGIRYPVLGIGHHCHQFFKEG